MDFINKQNAVFILLQLFQQRFETFLEITAVFGTRQQRTNIQRIQSAIRHYFRHIALLDSPCQPFGNGRFTYAGFAHQQRVVFTATAEHLDGALQFFVTANQRIDTTYAR
ncbi:hypothetical protein SRABI106_04584 [Rahnella aquatilis]|nr:hypothetical protein SRABI106_04584 [Rahnella aquatilis]